MNRLSAVNAPGMLRAVICIVVLGVTGQPVQAAVVDAFAQVVGGQSTTSQFASPLPTIGTFSFGSFGVFNPVAGNVASGVAADSPPLQTAATGIVSNSASLSTTFAGPNAGSVDTLTGSAASYAQSGRVGAQANASFTGSRNGLTVIGAQGAGIFSDTLTMNAAGVASGTPGTVRFGFTIDGSLSVTGSGGFSSTAGIAALYYQSTDPGAVTRILLNVQAANDTSLPNFFANPTTGFTVGNGSATGSNTYFTLELPMTWGSPFDFTFGLLAYVIPAPGHTGTVNFLSTSTLTSITGKANGQVISNFNVQTASGAIYTPNGVSIVPLPASLPLLMSGLLAIGAAMRRRRQVS